MDLKKLKVKNVKLLESTKVHDISVDEVEHYITENGIINHNSGREYGASIILMLTKSKLKDKNKEQIGITLTAKPNKNRFAKPNVVKTHLDYKTGLNAYTGLQEYIDFGWEEHGIERGEIFTEKEFKKKSSSIRSKCIEFEFLNKKTNETETLYYKPDKKASTIAVKELGRHLTSKEFFSNLFFTEERLKEIDEHVKPLFNYGIDDELPDEELFDLEDSEPDLDI